MVKISKRLTGNLGEKIALVYLWIKGYRPIDQNIRGPRAEVDLLCIKGDALVLVEVKVRRNKLAAHGAIHPKQLHRLQQQAQAWEGRYGAVSTRLDAVLVYPQWPCVEHIRNVQGTGW